MNNLLTMSAEFERRKNQNAAGITLGTALAILLLFYMLKWPIPSVSQPVAEEVIDIDLGDSETGAGLEEDMRPGEPAPAQAVAYTPPTPTPAQEDDSRDVETDDNAPADAPVIRKPVVAKPTATRIDNESRPVRSTPTPQPAVVQAPPRPRAVLGRTTGGNGNGGNGADTYSPGGGDGSGGTGNQGSVGGNPNGRGSGPRNLGVRIVPMSQQTFEDDFKEGGKIVLEVLVDENGKLISASYVIAGSTLPKNSTQYSIAMRRAREISWPKYEGGFRQKQIFNFTVK